MKLSAAIRIGSMTTRQIKTFLTDNANGRCALGAAMDAVNIIPGPCWLYDAVDAFPITGRMDTHPVSSELWPVMNVIWDLNDSLGWTREQIADWVETIEKKEEQEAVEMGQKKEAIPALA